MVKWVEVLIVLLFLLSLYLVLIAIFGHSPTPFEITVSLFITLGALLYNLNRELGEFKIKTINSFKNIKKDMYNINEKLDKIDKKIK